MPKNLWDSEKFAQCASALEQRVYSSRLLGSDPALVMHGGGNTSVKDTALNVWGEKEEALYIKGSGWDLVSIEAPGFPAVRLEPLKSLRALPALADPAMVNELRRNLFESQSPDPSVEALLHAFLPHRFVDHTHADAVLALTNQPNGKELITELYGNRVGVVPYVMPGFQLAKLCADVFESNPQVEGLVLLNHGVFSFGETAKESYERMIKLVAEAETFLSARKKKSVSVSPPAPSSDVLSFWTGVVRKQLLERGFRTIVQSDTSEVALAFSSHPEMKDFSQRGPLTPDHVIRTKRLPLIVSQEAASTQNVGELVTALDRYVEEYQDYVKECSEKRKQKLQSLDPFPRVVIIPGVGVLSLGTNTKAAAIAREIYAHTMQVILQAESLGKYQALSPLDIFDVEYWVLEQAKLRKGSSSPLLQGKSALVTGGAKGIGKEISRQLTKLGANVWLIDRDVEALSLATNEIKKDCSAGSAVKGCATDITQRAQVEEAITAMVVEWGGLDILVSNAGIFPPSFSIEELPEKVWNEALSVNLSGAYHLLAEALPWMKEQGAGGDIVFIASKNVPAPGKGAAAYSVSKAGLAQLARVTALEAGPHGIRVNMLHPHLILDTDVWKGDAVEQRAKAYQMTPDQYKKNNLLQTELSSSDVAAAVTALVSGAFSKTTGAQICIDGGHERTL